jgi:glyoxylate reductase
MSSVLVTRHVPPGGLDPLLAAGIEPVISDDDAPLSPAELARAAAEHDALVVLLTDRVDGDVLASGSRGGRLKVVANVAVGYDNIDVEAARAVGITVTNTPGVLTETTADLAFMLILAASRVCSTAEADLRSGRWTSWSILGYLGRDVFGATLGIVGYGRIGRAVARRASGFSMPVLHHARQPTGEPGYVADLDELLERADVVSLHVPLGPATRHLIDADRLRRMKPTAVLVNTARGPVVDEEALAIALEDGRLFAAGLDVFEHEPAVHPRLLAAPRTVLLPHIGSASVETRTRMARMACENVVAVLRGDPPLNPVV